VHLYKYWPLVRFPPTVGKCDTNQSKKDSLKSLDVSIRRPYGRQYLEYLPDTLVVEQVWQLFTWLLVQRTIMCVPVEHTGRGNAALDKWQRQNRKHAEHISRLLPHSLNNDLIGFQSNFTQTTCKNHLNIDLLQDRILIPSLSGHINTNYHIRYFWFCFPNDWHTLPPARSVHKSKQDTQRTYNVTLRRVGATTVAVKKK
jgi:hypothetical protein